MLNPKCEKCQHLSRNQCELDKGNPINMEIGSIVEYTNEEAENRGCQSFKEKEDLGQATN